MACEYFVNGNWVTEDQLKEILNNGLLDNLVASNKITLKGFKPDKTKVQKLQTRTVTKDYVPAPQLAKILADEVKNRQGYPPNMLSALELNAAGTDFKIPLWASPYAQKFESLLTSLVSNKVVKGKAPGNSYVLGSQEGFKVKEGDAAAGALKDSGIVFSANFDPAKGLLPLRYDKETGTMLPDQIMIPFKFRDESGKILNLKDFVIKGEDGRMMMDMDKIPAKLLTLMGYRIPTGGRNQMASIEIVGFLPETSGDLVLAPRDFTKRMGSDFDVDKLYTYNYNHFYDASTGQLKMNFLSDKKKIDAAIEAQKDKIDNLKKEFKLSKDDRKMLDAYIENQFIGPEEEEDFKTTQRVEDIITAAINSDLVEQLQQAFDVLSVLKRSYKAARENNIQDIRLQVLNSKNPEVLASNIALDSYGEFESLAPLVEAIRAKKGLVSDTITILSDTYQRDKYINATAGKDGVGSFSLDSTFNALVQGKNLVIQNLSEENHELAFGTFENPKNPSAAMLLELNDPITIFGDVVSKGDISDKYTLRSQAIIAKAKAENRALTKEEKKSLKLKSTIIRNLQSTSVDNEKFQILDKLNINTNTFDAIRAMAMLGFEEMDIAGLLTQEIMWEYLTKVTNAQSSLVAFNPNVEAEILQELIDKYDPENRIGGLSTEDLQKWSSDSGEQLIKNLETQSLQAKTEKEKTPDFNLKQLALLMKFKQLTEVGKDIKKLQSTVNTASKGLPKSLLELQSKVRQISNIGTSNIFNAQNLLGDYLQTPEGSMLIRPTTINGFASYYGAMFANSIYNQYFPYNSQGFIDVAAEVLLHMPNAADKSLAKQTEMRRDIFNNIRSFLYANTETNLFGENPTSEQRRLFIDVTKGPERNLSLARILQKLSKETWFQKNGFLNKLSFDLNNNGNISRINFEAAAGENIDERNIYDGFLYLLDKNFAVGTFNNIEYTSRTLAQDIVAAAFLEGGNQGAKQYLKYVPTSYLKTLGFGNYLAGIPFSFTDTFYGIQDDVGNTFYTQPSRFTRQYFQNNPDKTKTISLNDVEGKHKKLPDSFELTKEALAGNFVEVNDPLTGEPRKEQTKFVSIYDSKLPSKYALYEFDSASRTYKRLPVLAGSYGFVQYNSNSDNVAPIESSNRVPITSGPEIEAPGYSVTSTPVEPTRRFSPEVINNASKIENASDLVLAKNLSNTNLAIDDLLNTLGEAKGVSTLNQILLNQLRDLKLPKGFKVEYIRAAAQKLGGYNYSTNTLQINLNALATMTVDEFATTVAHELIHAHTGEAIYDYLDGKLENLNPEQIAAIQKLESLQQSYIKYLEESGNKAELDQFVESYKNWKEGKGQGVVGDVSKLYGAMKLTEFVTMALTDQAFQNHLKNIIDENGLSMWDKIKQMLSDLLQAMGLDIPAGSALASTIKSTMDLISATQETRATGKTTESFKYYGAYYNIEITNGVATDVLNLKKGASETNVKFEERKNKILSAFKENPSVDPQAKSGIQPISSTQRKTYSGKVTSLESNQIFVFGSNPEGRHGAGAAKYAKDNFGAIYGQGEGLQGQSYALPTKDLQVKENNGLRSISAEDITSNIKNLYDVARQNPTKEFLVSDYSGTNLNGYTGQEMANMFANAGPIPSNIVFHENFDKLISTQPIPAPTQEVVQEAKYELFPGVYANAGQRAAIDAINDFFSGDEQTFLLQGKGGTGKTTIIKKVLSQLNPSQVLAIAPSHKAKKVLDRSINSAVEPGNKKITATTLAAALAIKLDESTGKFTPDEYKRSKGEVPIKKAKYIIIDESSMVSDKLLAEIMQFAPKDAKIIFMGDRAQLPPVGQETDSRVFSIDNGYELREKMRQAATSPIINVGTVVSENVERESGRVANPITPEMRVNAFDATSGSSITWENDENRALDQFVGDIQQANGDVNFAKIVTFNNQLHNNPQSVKSLNAKVRFKLFGSRAASEQFIPGEILTAYDTFSFDQGPESLPEFTNSEDLVVQSVFFSPDESFTATAVSKAKGSRSQTFKFDINYVDLLGEDGKIRRNIPVIADSSKANFEQVMNNLFKTDMQLAYVLKAKFANLEYGYAITSHKAQGSTYKNVYVMEDNIMGPSNGGTAKAKNQSLYVAVSRPTTKLVMVSSKNTGAKAAPAANKFDPSKISDPSLYSTPPTKEDFIGEEFESYRDDEDKNDYLNDYYNDTSFNSDEMLKTSIINKDDYEKYLLICGK